MKQAKLSFAGRASNPVKASPAQLAARKRFAEMARSGAFKKATKRKANPRESTIKVGDYVRSYDFPGMHEDHYLEGEVIEVKPYSYIIHVMNRIVGGEKKTVTTALKQVEAPKGPHFITKVHGVQKVMKNPAKKTVSQKISQLRHEGYPQRQAVAVALSEQRAGKVKRNPSGLYAMKNQYLVSCPATKKNMGFFDKQSDAKIYAQELADKHGMQYAISTVKVPKIQAVHFVVGESTKSFKV
jgi:hypothetical protein